MSEAGTTTSQRAAITRALRDALAIAHRVESVTRDLGPGFLEVRLSAPERVSAVEAERYARRLAEAPTRDGLAPARVLEVAVDEDARSLAIWLELTDEHVRAPLGPKGDRVAGIAVLPSFDAAELAGVDTTAWIAEHGLDRTALLANPDVTWAQAAQLAQTIVAHLGREELDRMMESFVALTREAGVRMAPGGRLEDLYRGLLSEDMLRLWGAIDTARIHELRPGLLAVRLQHRDGAAPSEAYFLVHRSLLRALPGHHARPPARVVMLLDDDDGGATYVIALPPDDHVGASPPEETLAPGPSAIDRVAESAIRSRHAARTAVVERLGRTLAGAHDVHAVAEVVIDALMSALPLAAIQVDITTVPGGPLVPLRARGNATGRPIVRPLEHAGRTIGALSCWGEAEQLGELLAALDLLVPWVAVGFGTALTLAWERHERAQLAAERDGLAAALDGVLARHPGCAFVIDDRGRVHAANEQAQRALASGADEWLARLAHVVGEPSDAFDVLPVRVGARVERIVVLERPRRRSFEERLATATARWTLTERQRAVLACLARGMSNKEIAAELGCAEVTVENHLTAIFRKAGVDGRQRLVAAMSEG
jgi:DNA-binding CsgD family transcriptional regulator